MALRMRLRPGERMVINGAVIRNPAQKAVEVEILNEATLLHERDIMLPEQAVGPLDGLYFLIQTMHIEPEQHAESYKRFIAGSSQVYAQAHARGDADTCLLINELVLAVGERNMVAALKKLQPRTGRPGDARHANEAAG